MVTVNKIGYVPSNKEIDYIVDRRSPFGNPFTLTDEIDRDKICDQYEVYFKQRVESFWMDFRLLEAFTLFNLLNGFDTVLLCHCYPKRCHANTIADELNKRRPLNTRKEELNKYRGRRIE